MILVDKRRYCFVFPQKLFYHYYMDEYINDIPEEELKPPAYYPIEYALMWVAYGKKPINLDFAKIIYGRPPTGTHNEILEAAEKKLITYLRIGKIKAKSMEYTENMDGVFKRTGRHIPLDRTLWNKNFDWFYGTLTFTNSNGEGYEHTDIIVKTADLIKCEPITNPANEDQQSSKPNKSTEEFTAREKDSILKMVIAMAVDGYGYNPKSGKSPFPKELEGIIDRFGMSLSDDTIRKWLKEASDILPPQEEI